MKGAHCCQPDEAAAAEAAVLMIRVCFAHECARWSPAVLRYYNKGKKTSCPFDHHARMLCAVDEHAASPLYLTVNSCTV